MKVDETEGEPNSIEETISEFISCKLSEDDTFIDGLTDIILKGMIIPSGIPVKDDHREKTGGDNQAQEGYTAAV